MGRLTTHVLDIAHGIPGAGMRLELFRVGETRARILETRTNADGRCDRPLLEGEACAAGLYELVFHAGDYFAAWDAIGDVKAPEPRFIDLVILRFGIGDPTQHYHVPLLVSPFAYSTYRGT